MRVWSHGIPAPADKRGQGGVPGSRARPTGEIAYQPSCRVRRRRRVGCGPVAFYALPVRLSYDDARDGVREYAADIEELLGALGIARADAIERAGSRGNWPLADGSHCECGRRAAGGEKGQAPVPVNPRQVGLCRGECRVAQRCVPDRGEQQGSVEIVESGDGVAEVDGDTACMASSWWSPAASVRRYARSITLASAKRSRKDSIVSPGSGVQARGSGREMCDSPMRR